MILSIVLFVVDAFVVSFNYFYYAINPNSIKTGPHVLMIGVCFFSTLLCIPALVWNFNNAKNSLSKFDRAKGKFGFTLAVITYIGATALLIFLYVKRALDNGLSVF